MNTDEGRKLKNPGRKRLAFVLAVLMCVAMGLVGLVYWLPREDPWPLPAVIPGDTPMVSYDDDTKDIISPLPHVITFQSGGRALSTLALDPDQHVPRIALPDLPQLVTFGGQLPPSRRVLYYSCHVNSRGLRGRKVYSHGSSPDRYRIGIIGTGVTFGEGVEDHQIYASQLERMLNKAPPTKHRFEVINFGIPSLTTNYAVNTFIQHSQAYEVDFWIFALGVNDALPMFRRPLGAYRKDVRRLVQEIVRSGIQALMLVEPVNTFYPWMDQYRQYRQVMEAEARPHLKLLNMAAILDCHERRHGLRLEVAGEIQRVVQYRGGRPRVLATARYKAGPRQQFISPAIYHYLDTHKVWLRTFITDVHMNPRGHKITAAILYEYLAAKLRGKPLPDLGGKGCGVL